MAEFLLLSLLVSWPSKAQEPEQTAQPAKENSVSAEARSLEISRELSARQQAIENIQSDLGIYDQSLVEVYNDLARFYVELEDFDNSIRLYTDALQIARINTGLYSHEQVPILDSLIKQNTLAEP